MHPSKLPDKLQSEHPMLTYELKKSPGVPLYEALYRCIRGDILSGKLPAGVSLQHGIKLQFIAQLRWIHFKGPLV